jgi:alkylated DNA repair dioxygenase AlkB
VGAASAGGARPGDGGVEVGVGVDVVSDAVFERVWLDRSAWVDVARGWLRGADLLHAYLVESMNWRANTMWRYERHVTEPRLTAWAPRGRAPHPALARAYLSLRRHYGVELDGFGMSRYRDGNDSVGYHRDRELRWLDDTVIAILTTGARRPFMIKNRHVPAGRRLLNDDSGGLDFAPGSGDLLVMGGSCQADWLHAVPKVRGAIASRISVQWRWTSRAGQPERGPGYGAPRHFTR